MTTKSKHEASASAASSINLDEVKAFVAKVQAMAGNPPALTSKDRKRSAKLRKGGETVIPTVAALAQQYGLSVPGFPTGTMLTQLNQAQDLIPLHKQMVSALDKVENAIFVGHSKSWASATVHYTMLRRLAKTDGELASALAPVAQFFASGRRKGAKAAQAATTPASVATAPGNGSSAPATTPPATQTAAPSPAPINAPHS
jgi:hypothetical protein